VIGTFGISRDITERKQAEERSGGNWLKGRPCSGRSITASRTTIASITGLLTMHLHAITHPEAIAALQDAIGRLDSMHVLYDKLMLSEASRTFREKLRRKPRRSGHRLVPGQRQRQDRQADRRFSSRREAAVPLGIIINEILTTK